MRIPLALTALLLLLASGARAQDAPDAPIELADVPEIPLPAQSGAELLRQANALLQDGPDGEPSTTEVLAPDENLRRQRLAVARNAPALAKLRAALAAGIEIPAPTNYDLPLPLYARARELARQLWQESAVRAADGDAMASAQSSLDALRLGVQIARGPLLQSLVGEAIAAIARRSLEQNAAPRLDARQSREVAAQWQQISAQMPTYAQTLRAEEPVTLALIRLNFAAIDDPQKRAQAQKMLDAGGLQPDQEKMLREALKLSVADLSADIGRLFRVAIERASLPYQTAGQAEPLRGTNAYTEIFAQTLGPASRFSSERDALNNRLLVAALLLRAARLDGATPDKFDAGIDPFSPDLAPLLYRRDGDKYQLYSVGPDGKDNGGAPIQTLVTDDETGETKTTGRLAPNATGDIVAPVF